MNTNQMKLEMLERLESTADLAGRQVTVLAGLDRVGEVSDFDLQDQLTTMHEVVLHLRDVVKRSMRIVPEAD